MWTNLTGEESLEAEDVGCGLDGAENIGQEGERGEVGLGDIALMDTKWAIYSIGKNIVLSAATVVTFFN